MADYKVGYCKPPKRTQFKKGTSGNPKGRPKGSLNMATVLQKTLSETVAIVGKDGKRKFTSKMEAAVRALVDRAITGDMHAFRVLSVLTQALLQESVATVGELESADNEIVQLLVRQFSNPPAA